MTGKKLIDVYPYKIVEESPLFLLLKRAGGKLYEGQWRMIGGKVKEVETYWQAAIRELKEETNLNPEKFWSVPTINHFYEASTDQILIIPAFGAEVESDKIPVLDDEHIDFKWVAAKDIKTHIVWPEQIRIIHLISDLIVNRQILDEWIISAD